MNLKVRKVGTSLGVVLPKELTSRLKVTDGDNLFVIETPEGYLMTPYDPSMEAQLEAGRMFMKENRDTFRALAK